MHRRFAWHLCAALSCWSLSAAPTGALADVDAAYSSSTHWIFAISHLPDLDQKRTALPNDGKMYCVPTSAINWMAYFANHGRPGIAPGEGDWQSQGLYGQATTAIQTLGALMGTDPNDGTYPNGTKLGLGLWLSGEPVIKLQCLSDLYWSPTLQHAAEAVFAGGYVMIGVGWYDEIEPGLIIRDGGHALSLAYAGRSGSAMEVGWSDPNSDEGDRDTQSEFNLEIYNVQNQMVVPINLGLFPRNMSRVVGYGSAYVDSYLVFMPLFALTSQPDKPIFVLKFPFVFDGSAVPLYREFASIACSRIVDLSILQDGSGYVCIATPEDSALPNQLWIVNAASGQETIVGNAPLTDPTRVIVGRYRDLYLIDEGALVKLKLDTDPPDTVRITPPGEIGAMCYVDGTDEVLLVAADTRRLLRYPHHLDAEPEQLIIPPEVQLTGRLSLCFNEALQSMMFVSDESDSLWQLTELHGMPELVAEKIVLPGIVAPTDVQAGDDGRVYVSAQQRVVEVEYSPLAEGWTLVSDPYFEDLVAGDRLVIARSRSNDDPDIHNAEEWRNVLPAYCMPLSICRSYITRVLIGDIDQSSECDPDGGYSDFTELAAAIAPGQSLAMTVEASIAPPADYCGIWIDWDRDLSFDDPDDLVAIGQFDPDSSTFQATLTAPPDALPGATTMRVRIAESDAIDPCNQQGLSGETEDYTIKIIKFDPCPADVNGDGKVNIDDLFRILGAWGACDECPEDLNGDGKVNIDDLFIILGEWGPCP